VNTPKVNVDMDVENPWFPYNLPIHICIYICMFIYIYILCIYIMFIYIYMYQLKAVLGPHPVCP